jgi:hypothetical protein
VGVGIATVDVMADGALLPCASVTAPTLRESPEVLARRLAEELLESRQRIMRGVSVGVGVGLTISTVVWSIVGLGEVKVLPLAVLAAGLGLSTSMLTLALASTIFDQVVARHWRGILRQHGLDDATGQRALEDARRALAEARPRGEPPAVAS